MEHREGADNANFDVDRREARGDWNMPSVWFIA